VSKKPELIVIAGPNGSGKTTITKQLLKHSWTRDCIYINPDDIAEKEFGSWDSPEASLQAARKAERLREDCLAERRSLIFETVFSAPDKLEYVKKAMAEGFFVRLFFVCTDNPQINIDRIERRKKKGGHGVPHAKIISRYGKSIWNCSLAATFVDRAYIYDNSVEDHEPRILFRTHEGAFSKQYPGLLNDWAKTIHQSVWDG
jgi:predicted ABC-type ATPase